MHKKTITTNAMVFLLSKKAEFCHMHLINTRNIYMTLVTALNINDRDK